MKKFIIILFTLSLLQTNCKKANIGPTSDTYCQYADSSAKHPKNLAYQTILDKYVKAGMPGISAMLIDSSGTWIGCSGYADLENQIKFTPCHVSKGASITKLMVGTLTLKLVEEGKIGLDDPISKYIDESILKKIKNAEGKTVRNLMMHTTGIFDVITSSDFYLAVINNPNKDWTQTELLEFVYGKEGIVLNNPYPASYSNTNTILLSMCIEKATGEKHIKLLHEKIWDPLKMNNTYMQGRESLPVISAQGYFDLHNNGTIVNMSNFITGSGNGYGGVFSTVFDLNVFLNALFVERTILKSATVDSMLEFVREDEDFYTGLGTNRKFNNKTDYGIGHSGRDLGYSADLFYFPHKKCTLIFFVNYGTDGKSTLKPVFRQFENELADELLK